MRLVREADHSAPSGAAIPPLPYMSSWHSAELIKHRVSFTFPYATSSLWGYPYHLPTGCSACLCTADIVTSCGTCGRGCCSLPGIYCRWWSWLLPQQVVCELLGSRAVEVYSGVGGSRVVGGVSWLNDSRRLWLRGRWFLWFLGTKAAVCVDGWTDGQSVGHMDGWMDGGMDGWMDWRTDGWMDGLTDRWTEEWMDGWMDGGMDGWMDGRTDGRTHGWMDRWTDSVTLRDVKRWHRGWEMTTGGHEPRNGIDVTTESSSAAQWLGYRNSTFPNLVCTMCT
jgi:hypothetical protein